MANLNSAVSTAAVTVITVAAAVVLVIAGIETAAVFIAFASTNVGLLINLSKTQDIKKEVTELGNGKMRKVVSEAVSETMNREGGSDNGR